MKRLDAALAQAWLQHETNPAAQADCVSSMKSLKHDFKNAQRLEYWRHWRHKDEHWRE